MSKATRKQETPKESNAPTHALFHIEERGEAKPFWTEIAAGWLNADGSVNLRSSTGAVLLPDQHYQLRTRKVREPSDE